MTFFIDKLHLNLAMPDTLSTSQAKQVRGVLAVLPELIRDQLDTAKARLNGGEAGTLSVSNPSQIYLPDMTLQALLDSPVSFAQAVSVAVLKGIYPNYDDIEPLLNTKALTPITAELSDQQRIDRLFEVLQARQQGGEESLLALLCSGLGRQLSAQQASQFCRFIRQALVNNVWLKAADPETSAHREHYLSRHGVHRQPAAGHFKDYWLTLLTNPLVLERMVQILMKASLANEAVKLLWHMISDQALAPSVAALLQQSLQQPDDLHLTLHYLLSLGQSNLVAKEQRLSSLLLLASVPELDALSRQGLRRIFLRGKAMPIIEAATTWMTVAQIQRPTEQDKHMLAQWQRGVLSSTEAVQAVDAWPQQQAYQHSALAKLTFWRNLHGALLTLMQANRADHQVISVLAQLEAWLTSQVASAVSLLEPLADALVLLRQGIQQQSWPLDQQEAWLRVSILLKTLRQEDREGLLSATNPAVLSALTDIEEQLMGLADEALLAEFTALKQAVLAQQYRGADQGQNTPHWADELTQLAHIEQQVMAHLRTAKQARFAQLTALLNSLHTPLLTDHKSAPMSDLAVARYSLLLAPALPMQQQAELMSMLKRVLWQAGDLPAQVITDLKAYLQGLLINLPARFMSLDGQTDSKLLRTLSGSESLGSPLIGPANAKQQSVAESPLDLALKAQNSRAKPSLLAEDERAQGEAIAEQRKGRHGLKDTSSREVVDKPLKPAVGLANRGLNFNQDRPIKASGDGAFQAHQDQRTSKDAIASKSILYGASINEDHLVKGFGDGPRQTHQDQRTSQDAIASKSTLYGASLNEDHLVKGFGDGPRQTHQDQRTPQDAIGSKVTVSQSEYGLLEIAQFAGIEAPISQLLALYSATERERLMAVLVNRWYQLEERLSANADQRDKAQGVLALLRDWQARFAHHGDQPMLTSSLLDDALIRPAPRSQHAPLNGGSEGLTTQPSLQGSHADNATTDRAKQAASRVTTAPAGLELSEPASAKPQRPQALRPSLATKPTQTTSEKTQATLAQQVAQSLPLMSAVQGVEKIIQDVSQSLILEDQYTFDGGLILLWPFYATLFDRLGLLQECLMDDKTPSKASKVFVSDAAQAKAYALLYFLLGAQETDGYLGTANLLVGYEADALVLEPVALSDEEQQEASRLLSSAIGRWTILKNMPHASFQSLYLQRKAKISLTDRGVNIEVEKHTLDILMQKMPWGLGMIQLPWLGDELISVQWPY